MEKKTKMFGHNFVHHLFCNDEEDKMDSGECYLRETLTLSVRIVSPLFVLLSVLDIDLYIK